MILWLPLVMMARTMGAVGLAGAYVAFATFPFLGAGTVLNRTSRTQHGIRKRAWVAAAVGLGGIIATLGSAIVLGHMVGLEMYP